MKRLFLLILSVVLCTIIVVGCVAGRKQGPAADSGRYGKYVYSLDSTQYLELRRDGSYVAATREHGPSGGFGRDLQSFSGSYEIKGDIVTIMPPRELDPKKIIPDENKSKLRFEGNTLMPVKKMRRYEGAKFIKR